MSSPGGSSGNPGVVAPKLKSERNSLWPGHAVTAMDLSGMGQEKNSQRTGEVLVRCPDELRPPVSNFALFHRFLMSTLIGKCGV